MSDCQHCEHYKWATEQMYDTAIQLDEAEAQVYKLTGRLRSAAEALVWCLGKIDDPPSWIRCALDEAEASA